MAEIDEQKRFIQLRAQGVSFNKIAEKLKRSKGTLVAWEKKLKNEIAQLKSLELESLFEEYYLNKQNRIKTYGELLLRIREALNRKDFNDMSTEKLLKHYIQFSALLTGEYIEPRIKTDEEIVQAEKEQAFVNELLTEHDQLKEQN